MKALRLVPLPLLMLAVPAHAEKLTFDHRLYPPLQQILDGGDRGMIFFDDSNRRYLVDRIAISGKSATEWTEALEIIARTPTRGMKSATDWLAELRRQADQVCANKVSILAQDENSVTAERQSGQCPGERAPIAIYRIVAGKRSLFLLAVLSKRPLNEPQRAQWLALLASAHLD